MAEARTHRQRYTAITRPLERAALFAVAWWIISEGAADSWMFGVPFVAVATLASLRLTPVREWRLRPLPVARFAAYFVWQSIAGGIDVAVRAIKPSLPIKPSFMTYHLRVQGDPARVLLLDTVSLLPGTLSSGLEGDVLTLHVLDCELPVVESLRETETLVAAMLGATLDESVPGAGEGGVCDA